MLDTELKGFLAEVRVVMDRLDLDKHIIDPQFCGSKMFAQFGPEFHQRVCKFLSAAAIEAIDKIARNPHWYLLLVGTTTALAGHYPATTDDVTNALKLHRRILMRTPGMVQLLEKVKAGKFNKLSRAEFVEAGQQSLILIDVTKPNGGELLANPFFLW